MKRALLIGLLGALVGIGIYKAGQRMEQERSFTTARYAAEWGCLVSAQKDCPKLGESSMYPCMDEAIIWCPTMAEKFEKFLRH
jgi:hypothetical protein